MTVYASGDWHVKPGREDEFLEAWREFAEAGMLELPSDAWVVMLRDEDDPAHFRSVGPFRDDAAVAAWRDGEAFRQHMGAMREMLVALDVSTYEEALSLGSPRA